MPIWVANQIIKMLIAKGRVVKNSRLLILGLTFKENVNIRLYLITNIKI